MRLTARECSIGTPTILFSSMSDLLSRLAFKEKNAALGFVRLTSRDSVAKREKRSNFKIIKFNCILFKLLFLMVAFDLMARKHAVADGPVSTGSSGKFLAARPSSKIRLATRWSIFVRN